MEAGLFRFRPIEESDLREKLHYVVIWEHLDAVLVGQLDLVRRFELRVVRQVQVVNLASTVAPKVAALWRNGQ